MERDFLGLSTTTATPAVKHEVDGAENAPVVQRGRMQWSFSDRNSNPSQDDSFKSHFQEKPKRDISYRPPSPRFLTVSTTDNSIQPVYRPQGVRLCAVPNNHDQTTQPTVNYPVLRSHAYLADQNIDGFTSNPQSFGFVQSESPAPRIPTTSCFPTYTDTGISSKTPSRPAQLTIFYGGSVSVYDSVSPEEAQAIMLLAGKGTSSTPQSLVSSTQVHAPFMKPSTQDLVSTTKSSRVAFASPGLLSPVSTFYRVASQCGGVSDSMAMPSSQYRPEPPKVVNSQRSSVGYVLPGPVPQARKASLARFLEKRRERVTSTSTQPYSVEQKFTERERNASSASDNLSCTLPSFS